MDQNSRSMGSSVSEHLLHSDLARSKSLQHLQQLVRLCLEAFQFSPHWRCVAMQSSRVSLYPGYGTTVAVPGLVCRTLPGMAHCEEKQIEASLVLSLLLMQATLQRFVACRYCP